MAIKPMADNLIDIRNTIVERNKSRLLEIEKLVIPLGENTCIYGPNGSGKSTLLKLLMRFFYPSAIGDSIGSVSVLGQSEWNVWELRSHLSFVSSEIDHHFTLGRSGRLTPLQAVLTGFESSELPLEEESVTSGMREQASYWLDFFEIDSSTNKHVSWMSTGERRRVMLARAMVQSPQAILLDEPTSGLDLLTRDRLISRLNAMTEKSVQIILVTHHLEEVFPAISRCIMLQRGKVFFDGDIENAFSSNRLTKLFEVPITAEKGPRGFRAMLA